MERAVHDRGGVPGDAPIDRRERPLDEWEILVDALVGALSRQGLISVDELRRGMEQMPRGHYEAASYYERWLYSLELLMVEKGLLAARELDFYLGR